MTFRKIKFLCDIKHGTESWIKDEEAEVEETLSQYFIANGWITYTDRVYLKVDNIVVDMGVL